MNTIIAIEGTDGSGKTTARKYLYKKIASATGHRPFSSPSFSWLDFNSTYIIVESKYGEGFDNKEKIMNAYLKDKEIFSDEFIKVNIEERNVILDRYYISDAINNYISYNIPIKEMLHNVSKRNIIKPDVWIFMDTPPNIAFERVKTRGKPINKWETNNLINKKYNLYQEIFNNSIAETPVVYINNKDMNGLFHQLDEVIKKYIS